MQTIRHLVFLIHPCVFEMANAERRQRRAFDLSLQLEQQVKQRWLARLSPQWQDRRPILLQLDPAQFMVCDKLGFSVWPMQAPRKGDVQGTVPFMLTTADKYFVRAYNASYDALRTVLASATWCR